MPPEKMSDRGPKPATHASVKSEQCRNAERCMTGQRRSCQNKYKQPTCPNQGLSRHGTKTGQNRFHDGFDRVSTSGFHGFSAKVRVDIGVTL